AILLDQRFVNLWKEIDYFDICKNMNDLVIQGVILILFLPASINFINDKKIVVKRLKELIELGFALNDKVIFDIFLLQANFLEMI
ncbi:1624_t:CDS:1, partial [Scutellospora calospora]